MGSTDLAHLQRRARTAYELGRLRLALLGVAPVAVIIAGAMCLGHRPMSACGSVGDGRGRGGHNWYGRDPQRAVFPGIAAGMVPLLLALCANRWHACGANGCISFCVPACAIGGVIAGLAVAVVGNKRRLGVWFWVSASGLAVLTGAMGCSSHRLLRGGG